MNFDKFRPEAVDDVIYGVAVDYVGMDVPHNFGDSRLDNGRIIRLVDRPFPFCALLYSI